MGLVKPLDYQRCLWFSLQALDEELRQTTPAQFAGTDKLLAASATVLDFDELPIRRHTSDGVFPSPAEELVIEIDNIARGKHQLIFFSIDSASFLRSRSILRRER